MECCRPPSTTSIPIPSATWTTSRILRARSIYAPPCATPSGSVAPTLPCSSDLSPKLYSLFSLPPGAGLRRGEEFLGGASRCSARIERILYSSPSAPQHVCVDRRRQDVQRDVLNLQPPPGHGVRDRPGRRASRAPPSPGTAAVDGTGENV